MKYVNRIKLTAELRSSFSLAIPLVAAELIYAINGFFANLMAARLGKEQLAAHALVWPIYFAILTLFVGTLCSISVMVAQSIGANDRAGAGISFRQGLIISCIFSLPMMVGIWFAPTVLTWGHQDPEIIALATPAFHSLAWSMLPCNLVVTIQQFLVGVNRVRLVTVMSVLMVPIEIFFYYAFMFGKWGFPEAGIAGVGYGLAASYVVVSSIFLSYLYCAKSFKNFYLFKQWWIADSQFLRELFRIGWPLGAMWCSELIFFAITNMIIGTFGTVALAASQIANQYLNVALTILFAVGQTAAVRIGNAVGRNDRDSLWFVIFANILIGIGLISVFIVAYLIFPEAAIRLDIGAHQAAQYQEVVGEALRIFPIVVFLLFVESPRIILSGALRGIKDTIQQVIISTIGFWLIAFPAVYWLAFRQNLGGEGVWWGTVVGVVVIGGMLTLRFHRLASRIDLSCLVTRRG